MRSTEQGAFQDEDAETRKVAEDLGAEHGKAAGSWVIDWNTSDETCAGILRMIDEGDPVWEIPAPFSGEFADGLTLGWFSENIGVDEESDEFSDLCSAFEDAFYRAYQDEAERDARYRLTPDLNGPYTVWTFGDEPETLVRLEFNGSHTLNTQIRDEDSDEGWRDVDCHTFYPDEERTDPDGTVRHVGRDITPDELASWVQEVACDIARESYR